MAITDWRRRLLKLGYPETPRPERRVPSGLVGVYRVATTPCRGRIKQISKTGLYLVTSERWPVGEVIALALEREESPQTPTELQVHVQARVASYGEDGVGLGFVLPDQMHPDLWEFLVTNADAEVQTEHIVLLFRMVRTILFLCRLCPSGTEGAIGLLGKELDGARTSNALNIALEAEKQIDASLRAGSVHCHPKLLTDILREGSWSNDQLLRELWTGLLVSSCTPEGTDRSNSEFVELLVQVTPTQARILAAGCTKARRAGAGTDSNRIIVTPEQMIQISGNYDLYRSATDVSYLYNFGLIDKVFDFTTYLPKDSFDITPSKLGLELFTRCLGNLLTRNAG